MATNSLGTVLDPAYLEGLSSLPIGEVRSRRDHATEVEVGLSYLRRMIQGRLDIILAESRRRESGDPGGDVAELVQRLPAILGDRVRAPGSGRLPTLMAPAEPELSELGRLDEIIDTESLASLPDLSDEQLGQVADALSDFEHEVSADRRAIFEVIDRLQEEIVRRYKSGEATVDTLLS